jgi:sulfur transfer protein SufE
MTMITLTTLIAEARELPTPESQTQWVRSKAKFALDNRSIRSMENFVPGCEHPTWFKCDLVGAQVKFSFSCDGVDTQGVGGIIMESLTGMTVKQIRSIDFSEFRDIARYLNNRQQRTLNAMLNRIKDIIGDSE